MLQGLVFCLMVWYLNSEMFKIWANLSLLIGIVVLAGVAWFILYVVGKIIIEDIIGGTFKKIKRKSPKDDQYIY
jgi:hypothetical protein